MTLFHGGHVAVVCLLATLVAGCTPEGAGGRGKVPVIPLGGPGLGSAIQIDGIDGSGTDAAGVALCVAPRGDVYVIWVDGRDAGAGDTTDLWMNWSPLRGADGSWLEVPVRVNQDSGFQIANPQLHCSDDGAFVVWEDDRDGDGGNRQIYFNGSTSAEPIFEPEDLLIEEDADGRTNSLNPRIAGSGLDLAVVWADSLDGAYDILLNTSPDGGRTWRSPVRIDTDPSGASHSSRPQVALSDGGDLIWVVWEDTRNGATDIYFARSTNAGITFQEDVRIDVGDPAGSTSSLRPQLCADGGDSVAVVWQDARRGQDVRDIHVNASGDQGETWLGDAPRVDTQATGQSLHPACVPGAPGEVHVAWWASEPSGDAVHYRRIEDGSPVGDDAVLGQGAFDPRLDASDADVVVAWHHDGTTLGRSGAATSGAGLPLAQTGAASDLNVVVQDGEVYAAWSDVVGGSRDVWFQWEPLEDTAE